MLFRSPEVVGAAPYILAKTVISHRGHQDGILVYGIDAALSRDVIGLPETVTRGAYRLDSLPDTAGRRFPSVILGQALAERLGAAPGDKVFLADFSQSDFAGGGLGGGLMPRIQPIEGWMTSKGRSSQPEVQKPRVTARAMVGQKSKLYSRPSRGRWGRIVPLPRVAAKSIR